MNKQEKWLRLLTLVSQFDAQLNDAGGSSTDKETLRAMRSELVRTLLTEKPDYIAVEVNYLPAYSVYSEQTKAAAAKLMKEDPERGSYMYYLMQVEPCTEDVEDKNKSTAEITAECDGKRFYFTVPASELPRGYSVPAVKWEPANQRFHNRAARDNEEYFELITSIKYDCD